MTRMKTVLASAVVAAGLGIVPVIAQQTGVANGTVQHHGRRGMLAHMGAALNLTDAQKATAKQIFADGRQQAQPVMDQVKQVRTDMEAAVKANDTAQIATLAARQGQLAGQLAEIRAKGMAAFYAQLTPDQKAKADELHQQRQNRAQAWLQHRQSFGGNHANSAVNQ